MALPFFGRCSYSQAKSVHYFFQKQPAGRRGVAGWLARVGAQKILHRLGGHPSAPDFDEHAHDAAHHFPEEMRASEVDVDAVGIFADFDAGELDHGALAFFAYVAERAKIVESFEALGGIAHGGEVERVAHPPHVFFGECVAPFGDLIDVAAAARVVAGVESGRGFFDPQDVDVVRQHVVEAHLDLVEREAGGRIHLEVGHLAARVHACVGAACALEVEASGLEDCGSGFQKFALHGAVVFLELPTRVARAVVFDGEFEF